MPKNPPPCKSGDVGETREVTIGGVESLVGATAQAHLRHVNVTTDRVTLAATITDAPNRVVEVALGALSTDWLGAHPRLGSWSIEIEVTFGDGSKLTFPNDGHDILQVIEDLDLADDPV